MKRLILAVVILSTALACALFITRSKPRPAFETVTPAQSAEEPQPSGIQETTHIQTPQVPAITAVARTATVAGANSPARADRAGARGAIDTLLSPEATYNRKQEAWKTLMAAGQLDDVIRELEERAANEPDVAALQAVLGEACMKKCASTQDMREQAIWAMKADKTLETALKLDPQNWDARFTKTVGMSYWPSQLNKGQEVIDQFLTLIQQQEAQPAQPQFAASYLWLGNQYLKSGQSDQALQIWQRGAALFPNDEQLKSRLATAP